MEPSGTLNWKMVRVLKDDGCSTNMLFVRKNKNIFKSLTRAVVIGHSAKNSNEEANEIVIGAELKLENNE